jgi:biotin synthase-like enzyme
MSTKPKVKDRNIRRSIPSLLAEVLLSKKFGWPIGFLSGGVGAFSHKELIDMLKYINEIIKEKVWINIGTVSEQQLKDYSPFIKGVIGTVECVNPEVHDFVCPSKPYTPIKNMFENALKLGLKTGMTIIVGLGETKEDFPLMEEWIKKYQIEKIHMYALNPVKGTYFENKISPTEEYHAWWIAQTRIAFPKMDLQAGIWTNKLDRIPLLLSAGANSISKFPALKAFGTKLGEEFEHQAKESGREFEGTFTKMPEIDWDLEIKQLNIPEELKPKVLSKLKEYLARVEKNLKRPEIVISYDE